jgi:phenylpropionate dioxygenase-like ring-hydroxylating dioxygenase large terminal subunit
MTPAEFARLIDDRPADGWFSVHRDAFREPAVFDLEIAHVFESGWVYVGHASQLPVPHDFLTSWIGRQPVVLMRDAQGRLGCFLNSCPHKGTILFHQERGNRRVHLCHYHAWSFDSAGRNVALRDAAQGAYSEAFDTVSHDLVRVARFAEYRGFLFASLSPEVPALEDYLGDARLFLDLVVDQSEQGIELVPGTVRYTFRANWKLQLENTIDAYHFVATHPSYLRLLDRRALQADRSDAPKAVWQSSDGGRMDAGMGAFGFANGHALVWSTSPIERHPLYPQREALAARVGALRTEWMMRTRQFNVFPNLQLGSSAALQLRVIRPLAVGLTEMTTYCVAPMGESRDARRQRLRQYEDFFNPSGLATPDDTVNYDDTQHGMQARAIAWQQGFLRGMRTVQSGPDAYASALGIAPTTSMSGPFELSDETIFHAVYRGWRERILAGMARPRR